ncbi:MAG TPA: hypothetical protein VK671_00325, partial [Mucilaginibacter sp.]|nr:hypothetical protein [Mucilaginibacter sp.]
MGVEPLHNYISEENNTPTISPAALTRDAELDAVPLLKNSPNQMNKITNASKNVLQFLCFNSPYGGSFFQSLLKLEQKLNEEEIDMVYLFHIDTSHYNWVQNLIKQGRKIYFLTGN